MPASALLGFLSTFTLAQSGSLVFTTPPQTVSLGAMTGPIVVERRAPDGGALAAGQPAITVVLVSSASTGLLGSFPDPQQPWGATCSAFIDVGASLSQPCYYRDGAPGTATLTAACDAGVGPATQAVTVLATSFADDLESGTLFTWDAPPGRWNAFASPVATNSVAASAAAAHRGGWGVRAVDATSGGAASGQDHITFDMASIPGSYYLRLWFRVASSNGSGSLVPLQLSRTVPSVASLIDFTLVYPGPVIQVAGFDTTLAYPTDNTGVTLVAGWHLVEFQLLGLTTAAGTRKAWLDGALIATHTVNWTGMALGSFSIGEPWSGSRPSRGRWTSTTSAAPRCRWRAGSRPASAVGPSSPAPAFASRWGSPTRPPARQRRRRTTRRRRSRRAAWPVPGTPIRAARPPRRRSRWAPARRRPPRTSSHPP